MDYLPASLFLAKLIGVTFFIIGIFFLARTKTLKEAIIEFSKSHALLTITGVIRLCIGVSLLLFHNVWVLNWISIITLLSYLIFISGILRLFYQNEIASLMRKAAGRPAFFRIVGIIILAIGITLSYFGFWSI